MTPNTHRPSIAPPSSAPAPAPSWMARGSRVEGALEIRLKKTSLLDRFMGRLKGCCPFHFASGNGIQQDHANCEFRYLADGNYLGFKHLFKFKNYSNCFHCGLPQNNNRNAEEPACHSGFTYRTGQKCEFAGFIFKVVYALWTSKNATLLAPTLGRPKGWDSQEEFNRWVMQEDKENGRYINLLEIFIAFCTELEESDPNYFA
jgi:hypothetical protein